MSDGKQWQRLRKKALFRDSGRCQDCGQKAHRVHVHHIVPRKDGGPDILENLTTLCPDCHAKRHGADVCATCGGIVHERSGNERGLMDKKGGSPVIICDECWSRIAKDGLEDGCRLCESDVEDTRYKAGIGGDCGLPEFGLCDDCRGRLLFRHQYATMEYYDVASPINFRHWEEADA